jgi:LuxR family transcriptional regulator, maltose regulon positive regulatory protein
MVLTAEKTSRAEQARGRPKEPRTRFAPLESKILAPRSRPGLVVRKALVQRLRESTASPVVSLTAPAGYGKTSLVAQWAKSDKRRFAWISVDRADNEPLELLTYVALALNRLEPLGASVFTALVARSPAVEATVLPRLGKAVASMSRPFVLVLDDVHLIDSKRSLEAIGVLLPHLPAGAQIALVSRRQPALSLGRLRAEGALLELGPSDLAFDAAEADALLRAAGVRLGPKDLERIVHKTEGWPAGLYLAALALRGEGTVVTPVERFKGDDRLLADYFGEQVLGRLPRSAERFLTHTSILDRLSGELCDTVLESSGSGGTLRKLERSNLFLVPLDRRRVWYRYHTLFSEMLRRRLHDQEPELELELHSRAARWYAAHGEPEQAIRHAVEAGEVEVGGDLVWAHVNDYLARGRRPTMLRWLDFFTEEQVERYPPLALAAAWCAVEGEEAGVVERWTAAAARGHLQGRLPDGASSLGSAVSLLRAMTARKGITRMAEDAAHVRRLEEENSRWRASACFLEGAALRLSGRYEPARRRLEEGERIAESLDIAKVKALCLGQLALLAIAEDDWERAGSTIARAKSEIEEHQLDGSPTMKGILVTSTLVLAHQGQIEHAKRELLHARRLMALPTQVFPWLEIEGRLDLARTELLLGDEVAARTRLRETRELMRLTPDMGVLRTRFDELAGQLESAPATGVAGPSALTTAEVRVLHFLPTHLSFREIGERMHLSRNTVKTQAGSVYRKLGVSRRSDAVDRARDLGLIEV